MNVHVVIVEDDKASGKKLVDTFGNLKVLISEVDTKFGLKYMTVYKAIRDKGSFTKTVDGQTIEVHKNEVTKTKWKGKE